MDNEYLKLLQKEYDSPQKAWVAYTLQKGIWKTFAYTQNAEPEVKESFKLQKAINDYCLQLSQGNKPNEKEILFGGQDILKVLPSLLDNFEFLGLDRSETIKLASGMLANDLKETSSSIKSWEQLNDLMIAEKNTLAPQEDTEHTALEVCKSNGLTSIMMSKGSSQLETLKRIDESFSQLASVIGCRKQQIGMNEYNVAIDTDSDTSIAGCSSQHFKHSQKLYVRNTLSYDAFAHEWFHGMDNIWAQEEGKGVHQSVEDTDLIKNLLDESRAMQPQAIEAIKEHLKEKTIAQCYSLIDRYDRNGYISDAAKFKEYIKDNDFINSSFDKNKFNSDIEKFKNADCPPTLNAYLSTEIETARHFNQSKALNNSFFWEYAQNMDKNLVSNGWDWASDYSKSNEERFARLFETYCDIKLRKQGIKNIISSVETSAYTPRALEVQHYLKTFDKVIDKVKSIIDKKCPQITDTMSIMGNIEKMRMSHSSKKLTPS